MKTKVWGHLSAAFTTVVWGTTLLSTTALLKGLSPTEIMLGRIGVAFLLLNLLYLPRLHLKKKRNELWFALAGLCGVTLYFYLENTALRYINSPAVGIIISTAPFFTALFAHFFSDGERLTGFFFAGFAFAMAGIVLISVYKDGKPTFALRGTLMALGAAVCWGVYSVVMRRIGQMRLHPIQTTRRIFFWGLVCMVPLCLWGGEFSFADYAFLWEDKTALLHILYLGVVASALCFVTWNFSLDVLGAVGTTVYIYGVPVVTVIASALIDHTSVSVEILVGVVLAVIGLVVSSIKKAK